MLERSLTFTNHRAWWGSKDRNRLAAGSAVQQAQLKRSPLHCQPRHTAMPRAPQPWGRAGSRSWGTADGWREGQQRQASWKTKPSHHNLLLTKARACQRGPWPLPYTPSHLLRVHLQSWREGVCWHSHTMAPAYVHHGPHFAALARGECSKPTWKWSQCLIILCARTDFYSEFVWFKLPANGSRSGVFSC